MELEKLTDTAIAFGCSFKAVKVWVLLEQLKLLGTMVGGFGLGPDPEKVAAVENFAEITGPKVA